jgi:ligand-binding SRPBCC domain-containing protein
MPQIILQTSIQAPIERCFFLSLSVDMHIRSTAHTGEKAVGGVTSGIMKLGDYVTWRARHFGIWQELSSQITKYEYPTYFCDEMINGAFKSMRHAHHFQSFPDYTLMRDVFYFESPLGLAGKLANRLFLNRYMKNLLMHRNESLKTVAESEQWKQFIAV